MQSLLEFKKQSGLTWAKIGRAFGGANRTKDSNEVLARRWNEKGYHVVRDAKCRVVLVKPLSVIDLEVMRDAGRPY